MLAAIESENLTSQVGPEQHTPPRRLFPLPPRRQQARIRLLHSRPRGCKRHPFGGCRRYAVRKWGGYYTARKGGGYYAAGKGGGYFDARKGGGYYASRKGGGSFGEWGGSNGESGEGEAREDSDCAQFSSNKHSWCGCKQSWTSGR